MTSPANPPAVSAVIPVRNGARFLAEAIASVQAQTHPVAEILVVDDGSVDDSGEIAEACGARCLRLQPSGLPAARNAGVAATASPLVAFLDSDDVWMPEKIGRQVAALRLSHSLGFVSTAARVRFEPGVSPWTPLEPGDLLDGPVSTWLVPREVFDVVGGFDPVLRSAEDLDWRLRARDAGILEHKLTVPLLEYRVHGANMTYDREAIWEGTIDALRGSLARRRTGGISGGVHRDDV